MSRVFVWKRQPGMDFSGASEFGELVVIHEAMQQRVNQYSGQEMGKFLDVFLREVDFQPAVDFILLAGPNIAVAQLFAFVLINYEAVNFLNYNALESKYVETPYRYKDYDQNT